MSDQEKELNQKINNIIEENKEYILEEDYDKWIKELFSSKTKLSNITSRYIKKTTKKNIENIINETLDNLDVEYIPYKKKIKEDLSGLKNRITVKNFKSIFFNEILSNYQEDIDIKQLEIYWKKQCNENVNPFTSIEINKIKEFYETLKSFDLVKEKIKEYLKKEADIVKDSISYENDINQFFKEHNLLKYNIKLPPKNKLTKEFSDAFKLICLKIKNLESKEILKTNIYNMLSNYSFNNALIELIKIYRNNGITIDFVTNRSNLKVLKFKKTCEYANIFRTFSLKSTLDLEWGDNFLNNINEFKKIDNKLEELKLESKLLSSQYQKIMSGIEEVLMDGLFDANPLTKKNWDKKGLNKAIFYQHGRLFFDSKYEKVIEEWHENLLDKAAAKELLEKVPDLKDIYYKARKKERKVVFYAGETNSGKTYSAFNDLVKYEKGIYLAPLRLLALEGQEEIIKRGKNCSYLTGEESDIRDDANFICSTIEMLNINEEYECAIIDEIQMIADKDRGTSWLEALIGVNSNKVILTGTKAALPIIKALCKYTDDDLEVIYLDKKTKLKVDDRVITTYNIPNNSAIIAFSKKEIHRIKSLIKQPTAIIYGALSPEVRRQEAEKFRSGEAKILISTDAIGMGLNLPIENIYFSHTEKFNGVTFGLLKEEEIFQISGRAGRYKLFDEGRVGFIDTGNNFAKRKTSMKYIKSVLEKKVAKEVDYATFSITRNMFNILSDLLDSEDLSRISRFFFKFMEKKINQSFINVTIPTDFYDRLDMVDSSIKELESNYNIVVNFEDKLNLLFLPLDASKKLTEGKSVINAFLNAKYLNKDDYVKLIRKRKVESLPNSLLGIEILEKNVHMCDLLHNLELKYPDYRLCEDNYEESKKLYEDAMIKIINENKIVANCRKCERPIKIGLNSLCNRCR